MSEDSMADVCLGKGGMFCESVKASGLMKKKRSDESFLYNKRK